MVLLQFHTNQDRINKEHGRRIEEQDQAMKLAYKIPKYSFIVNKDIKSGK